MTIAVIEYTPETAHLMRSDYAARRARLYAPEPRPVAVVSETDVPSVIPRGVRRRALVALALKAKDTAADDAVRDWIALASPAAMKPASWTKILTLVSEATNVSRLDMVSDRRTLAVVRPRQVACWLMRNYTTMSLPEIGRRMGGRDHTTILAACRKIDLLLSQGQRDIKRVVDSVSARICESGEDAR